MMLAEPAPRLPREAIYVVLAAPLVSEPILNPDFFRGPAALIAREITGNLIPAVAIALGLWAAHAALAPAIAARLTGRWARTLALGGLAGAVAGVAGALVLPLHRAVAPDELDAVAYVQRNVGFTAITVVLAAVLDDHRRRARAADQAALRAQLDALQSRTQPHFLFNALNTIAALIRDDAALAEQTVHRLAALLRHALVSTRSASVAVARELEVVGEYLAIQRVRYGARLRCSIEVERAAGELAIPPFVVQPLVENAVLHAVAPRAAGATIAVRAFRRGEQLVIEVDDDGPGPGGSAHRGSATSLEDLRARLALRYGAAATVALEPGATGGCRASLALPAEPAA